MLRYMDTTNWIFYKVFFANLYYEEQEGKRDLRRLHTLYGIAFHAWTEQTVLNRQDESTVFSPTYPGDYFIPTLCKCLCMSRGTCLND